MSFEATFLEDGGPAESWLRARGSTGPQRLRRTLEPRVTRQQAISASSCLRESLHPAHWAFRISYLSISAVYLNCLIILFDDEARH